MDIKKLEKINLLLIEDDDDFKSALVSRLVKRDFNVTAVVSAEEALDKLKHEKYDVVVSDIRLNGMNGMELLSKVKELNEDLPVIIITGYANLDTAREAVTLKAYDYLLKPLDNIEELIKKVKKENKDLGIAINPDTPLTKIVPYLNELDLVLIMSVIPGWSGQDFIWESIDKVDLLVAYRAYMNMGFLIDIDGGVSLKNAGFINSDIVSSSSAILKAYDPNLVIQKLKEIEYHD